MDNLATSREYQPVSRLAVASLALGVASLVVLVAPPAAVLVPIFAVLVSVAAVVRLNKDASLAGRGIAKLGLALSLFAIAAGPTCWFVRRYQLRTAAEQVAVNFVERLLAGDVRAAHQMTVPPKDRVPIDRPLAESYGTSAAARASLAEFSKNTDATKVVALNQASVKQVAVEWNETRRHAEGFGVLVRLQSGDDEVSRDLRLIVERQTNDAKNAGADWIVLEFHLVDAASNAAK